MKPGRFRAGVTTERCRQHNAESGCNEDTRIGCFARTLNLVADEGASFTPDDLDAVICAVTGVADEHDVLRGDKLASKIAHHIKTKLSADMQPEPPKGFVLLKRWPQTTIRITKADTKYG